MNGEFGLAGGGEEHIEDWLECLSNRVLSASSASCDAVGPVSSLIQIEPNRASFTCWRTS